MNSTEHQRLVAIVQRGVPEFPLAGRHAMSGTFVSIDARLSRSTHPVIQDGEADARAILRGKEADLIDRISAAQAETKSVTGTVSYPTPIEQVCSECDEGQAVEHRLGLTRTGEAA